MSKQSRKAGRIRMLRVARMEARHTTTFTTGRDGPTFYLPSSAVDGLRRRTELAAKAQTLAEQLAAEVDGLRNQNAMLTELLQRQP